MKPTCKNGCYDQFPYICRCNVKIKNPIDPTKLRQEYELGEQLKSGHTVKRIGKKDDTPEQDI